MRKKNIVIFGHYGVPNWGDEAILKGILSKLDFERFSVTVVSDNPVWTQEQHGVNAVFPPPLGFRSFFRGNFLAVFSALKNADFVFFGGGGLFQEHPEKAFFIWTSYLRLCLFFTKKIIIVGNSFEKVSEKRKKVLQKLFASVKFFSVRDAFSQNFLHHEILISSQKIALASDAALLCVPKIKKKTASGEILISIRNGELSEKQEKTILSRLKKRFPKSFAEKKIVVLVMQEKNAHDSAFAVRHHLPAFFPENLEELETKIAQAEFVFTSRLHAGILAFKTKTPFFALSPRGKIEHFFDDFCTLSVSQFFSKKGAKKFEECVKVSGDAKKREEVLQKHVHRNENFFPGIF